MYLTREPIHVYDVIASPPGPSLRGAEGDEAISEIASASFGTPPRNDETSCFPGASVLFLGIVRDHSNGRKVISLEYEAYEEMAERMLAELVTRAFRDWPVEEVRLLHRLGPVHLGEIAVAIAVESVHRDEAYAASRFLIEEIKHRIPIWKKEYFTDGSSEWSQCPAVIARRPPKKAGTVPEGDGPPL